MNRTHLEPTQKSGAALFSRRIEGEVVMLNLLRFREIADYFQHPELMPTRPISGREAYQKYMDHTQPILEATGGGIMFLGEGGSFLIGPEEERWDAAMLVRQKSLSDFLSFATHKEYLAGIGHRTAALEDSRLLPLVEVKHNRLADPSTTTPKR
jgi:uncharacterized protein (DUF1330 family)